MTATDTADLLPDPSPLRHGSMAPIAVGDEDPLAQALPWLMRHFGVAAAVDAALADAGIATSGARLGSDQVLPALRRIGFDARVAIRALPTISADDLPAVLLLRSGDACVLTRRDPVEGETAACTVVIPDAQALEFTAPESEIAAEYSGLALLVRRSPTALAAVLPVGSAVGAGPLASFAAAIRKASRALAPSQDGAALPASAPQPGSLACVPRQGTDLAAAPAGLGALATVTCQAVLVDLRYEPAPTLRWRISLALRGAMAGLHRHVQQLTQRLSMTPRTRAEARRRTGLALVRTQRILAAFLARTLALRALSVQFAGDRLTQLMGLARRPRSGSAWAGLPLLTLMSANCLLVGLPLTWAALLTPDHLGHAAVVVPGMLRAALAADPDRIAQVLAEPRRAATADIAPPPLAAEAPAAVNPHRLPALRHRTSVRRNLRMH